MEYVNLEFLYTFVACLNVVLWLAALFSAGYLICCVIKYLPLIKKSKNNNVEKNNDNNIN